MLSYVNFQFHQREGYSQKPVFFSKKLNGANSKEGENTSATILNYL